MGGGNNKVTKKQAYTYITKPFNVVQTVHDHVDFSIQDHDKLTIVFSATNSTRDWITNALFFKKKFHYCRAHGGYIVQYRRIQHLIHAAVQHTDHVQITGYSMGASFALITAYDIKNMYPTKRVEVIAFDPLRAFNTNVFPTARTITYGNSTVHKLLRMFLFKHAGVIEQYGPTYKWWKYNHKDHKLENLEATCVGEN
jgi:hypothetical protein